MGTEIGWGVIVRLVQVRGSNFCKAEQSNTGRDAYWQMSIRDCGGV